MNVYMPNEQLDDWMNEETNEYYWWIYGKWTPGFVNNWKKLINKWIDE